MVDMKEKRIILSFAGNFAKMKSLKCQWRIYAVIFTFITDYLIIESNYNASD